MITNKIFFAPEGYDGVKLTSTSANYIANLAKEMIRNIMGTITNLQFYNTDLTIIGSDKQSVIKTGVNSVEHIPETLKTIAGAKSLIAWLREAIAAKKALSKQFDNEYTKMFITENGIEVKDAPKQGHILTEAEYYDSLTVKERNHYYELETMAAVLGQAIHPDGAYAKAREEFNKVLRNPTVVEGNGRDTLIYTNTPSISQEEVEKVYFELQNKYREVQAELNSMKYKCDLAIEQSQNEVNAKYQSEYKIYLDEQKMFQNQIIDYYNKGINKIMNLKIIIPNSLKDIYEKVSKLGK